MPLTLPKSKNDNRKSTVRLINLGCAKNVVDSEEMLGVLAGQGYCIDGGDGRADVVIINTCGFIDSAKQESIDTILGTLELKKTGEVRKVVVAGCLVQRYASELATEIPEIDAFLGTGKMGRIAGVIDGLVGNRTDGNGGMRKWANDRPISATPRISSISTDNLVPQKPHHRWLDVPTRVLSTAPWTAYLKISEGCDHRCTFCAIPSFRGDHVSKPLDRILEEAEMLARSGVKELNLIAQDSTQYGYDLYQKPMLPTLLRELSGVEGVHWIRLFYCYPSRVNAEVIEAIATTPNVCQYIDMPLQHADDEILRAMKRPMSGEKYLQLLKRFRDSSPDVAIRTTFIVGFPGETEAHFDNLLRFVDKAQFDRAGVFEYSVEDGTPSADLPDRVPARVKRSRKDRLMRLQQQISLSRNRAWVGREVEVLVEKVRSIGAMESWSNGNARQARSAETEHGCNGQSITPSLHRSTTPSVCGRSFRDAPEIDGQVFVSGTHAEPGEFINVRITEAKEYDLMGLTV